MSQSVIKEYESVISVMKLLKVYYLKFKIKVKQNLMLKDIINIIP